MTFRAAALPALALGIVFGVMPAGHSENSFEVPRGEILGKVHRVGLMPMTLAEDFKDRNEVKTRYEELLTERLQKLGWEVVPSAKYDELLLRDPVRDARAADLALEPLARAAART